MKEIQGVKLEPARNAAHYELVHQILEFAAVCQAVTQHMTAQYEAFRLAVEVEGRILGISLKSDLSEPLLQTDRERDGEVSSTKWFVNALQWNPNPEIAQAARQLMTQFESLKVDTSANYLQETGEIDILLSALRGTYAEQVETCQIGKLVDYIEAANERMHQLLNERDVIQAPRVGTSMEDARRETDTAYRALIKYYNAWILLNAATATEEEVAGCERFSTETNAKLEYFKRYVLKQTTSSKPEEVETGGSSSEEEETGGESTEEGEDTNTETGGGSTGSGSNQDWDV